MKILWNVTKNGQKYFLVPLRLLKGKSAIFVKIDCPLDELEKREIKRVNREIGIAEEQCDEVHKNHIYDL